MANLRVNINSRTGKALASIDVPDSTTVDELKQHFCAEAHYYPERQRLTLKEARGPVLVSGTLKENGVVDGATIVFKDLGVQISWRLVFVLEYLGPLLIFPFLYFCSKQVYGKQVKHSRVSHVAFYMIMGHFLKREFETLFIHRFSNATMPLTRLPINCCHYWLLCAAAVGYYLFHPLYTPPISNPMVILALLTVFFVSEFFNLQTHLHLRTLRSRNSRERGIPDQWGFQFVSCANYFYETLAWLSFCVLTNTLTGWVFFCAAFGQMTIWALKKHRNYRKEFKNYPK